MSWISVEPHEPRTIKWWFNEFARDRIEMAPGYQRRSNLWGRSKKAHLIDSIINGFDVPKFYVADFTRSPSKLNESNKPFAVIDGKQRFEAIFSYLDNEFPLNGTASYQADPSVDIAGLTYSELLDKHPLVARSILDFVPVVMSVASDSTQMIEQMFVRLNSGVAVNGAERRNAMPGPIPQIVRDITVHPFFSEKVRFSKDRMQEFNLAAKLLMFEHEGEFTDSKARNLDYFVSRAHQQTEALIRKIEKENTKRKSHDRISVEAELEGLIKPYTDAEEAVMATLERMSAIFAERDPLLKKQGEIPVYYWLVRTTPSATRYFRRFLEEFEPAVIANMRLARDEPDSAEVNPELLAYYNAVRTSNDKASLVQRYRILRRRYMSFVAALRPNRKLKRKASRGASKRVSGGRRA